ncbi:MAG: DNA polymerase III subunit alpha, partial [Minisyncoccales bacterium]
MKFTHLHVHSHYSLLDGLPKIDELIQNVKEKDMDSVALTDHGVMYGAVEFFKKAKEAGIKPIIGCEVYVAYEGMEQKRPNIDNKRYHLVLLAKNKKGYQNLVKLVSKAHLKGFYYKPRIDEELLKKHSEGLIGLTACIQGEIPQLIISNKKDQAKELIKKYKNIFKEGDFYLEIQDHPEIKEQTKVNKELKKYAEEFNLPLVATCDVHYLEKEDAEAQDILMRINTGTTANDSDRLSMKESDFSLRSPKEMKESFKDTPEAIKNTQKIVEKCDFEFELGGLQLPKFEVPKGKTAEKYLKELSYEGAKERYGEITEEIDERLTRELTLINNNGFSTYFLIVQDFINWAKNNGIVVGPGRGSAAGSLVSYCLNITNVDPLKYNLIFERFMNGERISPPDIDIDFTDKRRDEVIEYVADKYGEDKVAQIITFGTMAARGSIRDVGRALGYSYDYCDKIAKLIPFGNNLKETLEEVDEFKQIYKEEKKAKILIDYALKLEGCARHASTHACGVVISPTPLNNIIPTQNPSQNEDHIITQYEMHAVEDLGLLKMDFLGLKNLTIIEETINKIKENVGDEIKIEDIPLEDKKTFKLFQNANTTGVFQLESQGMKSYLKQLKPTKFEDIIAMVALYRPGPMELIPKYINRKHGKEEVEYIHPDLKPILKSTYGILVYQEQVMKIAQELAGFSLGEADVLRKAIGKKIKELLMAQKEKFIKGVVNNNISKEIALQIWNWIEPFAEYSFNRSHAASY